MGRSLGLRVMISDAYCIHLALALVLPLDSLSVWQLFVIGGTFL